MRNQNLFAVAASRAATVAIAICFAVSAAFAQAPADPREAELKAAWEAADKTGRVGPDNIDLREQAVLKIATGQIFVPASEGLRVMRAYGNRPNEATFAGLVVGTGASDNWLVVVNFIKEGYIKDDDAKDWNADDLLTSLKEGTEEVNKERAERGFPQIEIVGWVEKPAYDSRAHRLVWSMATRQRGESATAAQGVNYNTYALGREGYFSLNLLTELDKVEAQKPVVRGLLADLAYDPGKRYEDFNATTDKVAEYGLAALIGVGVAKKLGFLGLLLAFALKFAKIIALGVAGVMAVFYKIIGRKKSAPGPDA